MAFLERVTRALDAIGDLDADPLAPLLPGLGRQLSVVRAAMEGLSGPTAESMLFERLAQHDVAAVLTAARVLEHASDASATLRMERLEVPPGTVRLVHGALEAEQIANGGLLVVMGSLRTQRITDFDDLPCTVVLGDLHCTSCHLGGGLAVGGLLEARRFIHVFDDGASAVVQTLRADVALAEDRAIRAVTREVEVDIGPDFDPCDPGDWAPLRARLVPDILPALPEDEDDEDGWLELEELDRPVRLDAVEALLSQGSALLRE